MPSLKSFVFRTRHKHAKSSDKPSIVEEDQPTTLQDVVNQLPPELLIEIFLYIFPSAYSESQQLVRNRLGSVCSRWRQVILNSPSFWNKIDIVVAQGPLKEKEFDRFLSKLQLSLSRSGTAVLDIAWDTPYLNEKQTKRILEALYQHDSLRRWRNLTLGRISVSSNPQETLPGELSSLEEVTFSFDLTGPLGCLVEETAINLKHLKLDHDAPSNAVTDFRKSISRISFLAIADMSPFSEEGIPPNIKSLSLEQLVSAPQNPFTSIVNLNLGSFSLDQPALLSFPNLEYLQGRLIEPMTHLGSGISLLRLRRLDLEVTYGSCPSIVWIVAPLLKEFYLRQQTNLLRLTDPLMYMDMERLNNRQRLPAKILNIQCYSEYSTLSAFLGRFPQVEHLTICFRFPKNRNMFAHSLLGDILPNLITLRMELAWNKKDLEDWAKFAIRILKKRRLKIAITCVWADGTEITVNTTSLSQWKEFLRMGGGPLSR